jgi:hypothetical protein
MDLTEQAQTEETRIISQDRTNPRIKIWRNQNKPEYRIALTEQARKKVLQH